MQKNQNKSVKKPVNENKEFLIKILNNNITERIKVNKYLQSLNKTIKILKNILEELK